MTPENRARVVEQLREALHHAGDTHTLRDIADGLMDRRFFALWGERSVGVFEVVQYPRARALHCFLGAGDLDDVGVLLPQAERAAADLGCDRITFAGRPGWVRVLRDEGFAPFSYVCMKRLGPAPNSGGMS